MRARGEGVGGADDLRRAVVWPTRRVARKSDALKRFETISRFELRTIRNQNAVQDEGQNGHSLFFFFFVFFYFVVRHPHHVGSKGKLRRVMPAEQGPSTHASFRKRAPS